MVMKRPVLGLGLNEGLSPMFTAGPDPLLIASKISYTIVVITDSTSSVIRLNSSKQPQQPHIAKPAKIVPIEL